MLAGLLAAWLTMAGGEEPSAIEPGTYRVLDADGTRHATVTVRRDRASTLRLLPGRYRLVPVDDPGRAARVVQVERGAPIRLGRVRSARPPAKAPSDEQSAVPAAEGAQGEDVRPSAKAPPPWAEWASPLAGAFVPGLGHALARRPGRALALFATTAGFALGVTAVVLTDDPSEGTDRGDGDSAALEIARHVGLSTLTTGLAMLWAGQLMDAHAVGRGRPARPVRDYAVALSFSRFSTIGMRAGQPAYDLYDDFHVTALGQVAPRLEVGVGDLSVKLGDRSRAYVVQAGPRAMWRFWDRQRLWFSLGGGFVFQGASSPSDDAGLAQADDREEIERGFAAVPYLQVRAEWFLLDRWSLGLTPRLSVPLTDRFYARGRKIPRFATTFELGASVGVRL